MDRKLMQTSQLHRFFARCLERASEREKSRWLRSGTARARVMPIDWSARLDGRGYHATSVSRHATESRFEGPVRVADDGWVEVRILSRALTATAWTLPGVWLVHMSAFLYVYGMGADGSLHQLLWPADQETDAEQAVGLYLALDVLLAAGLVALAQMFGLSAAETEASARVVPATETNGLLQIEEEERN